jgi:uncharacterized cupredoxin-like copper-binding protein
MSRVSSGVYYPDGLKLDAVSRPTRIEILAVAAIATLLLGGCGSSDNNHSGHQATTVAFAITDGRKTSGPDRIDATSGDSLTLELTSNVADELHVHGYDKEVELAPNVTARLTFTTDIPGTFEIELHSNDAAITSLRVEPGRA